MINAERKIVQSEIKKKNNNKKRGEATNQTQTVKVGNTLFKSLEAQREQTESVTRNKASKKTNKKTQTDDQSFKDEQGFIMQNVDGTVRNTPIF